MKIENNGINPMTPPKMQPTNGTDKKIDSHPMGSILGGHDHAELSENARLLAKARAGLEEGDGINTDKVNQLREQIQNGDYSVRVEDLARRMLPIFRM